MAVANLKTENEILESKELREELLSRVEVLDKVKTLFLLPKLEMMTTKQVGEFYEVPYKTISDLYLNNKEEMANDGVTKNQPKTLEERFPELSETKPTWHRGYKEYQLSDTVTLRVPSAGILMFSKRAILRIGMLLRDSEIAKEVRTQLLNTFEEATPEQRTVQMNTEQELTMNVLNTISIDDPSSFEAFVAYRKFMTRHVTELEEENKNLDQSNKMLAGEILAWSDRSQVNRVIRYLANALKIQYKYVWSDLYNELLYKHGINLKTRKTKKKNDSMLSTVEESEWPAVQQSLAALCEQYGFDPAKLYHKALKYQA